MLNLKSVRSLSRPTLIKIAIALAVIAAVWWSMRSKKHGKKFIATVMPMPTGQYVKAQIVGDPGDDGTDEYPDTAPPRKEGYANWDEVEEFEEYGDEDDAQVEEDFNEFGEDASPVQFQSDLLS